MFDETECVPGSYAAIRARKSVLLRSCDGVSFSFE